MKKTILFFAGLMCCAPMMSAHAAVAVKKAAPVATQESAGTAGAASLIPTVLGLVSGVQALNAQQQALTAECIPTTAELNFVNTTMQEWASRPQPTGRKSAMTGSGTMRKWFGTNSPRRPRPHIAPMAVSAQRARMPKPCRTFTKSLT